MLSTSYVLPNLSFNPSHYQFNKKLNLLVIQNSALLYSMPFLHTTPATGAGGMLSNQNRVNFHWGLFTIVFRILGSYSGFNEINSVLPFALFHVQELADFPINGFTFIFHKIFQVQKCVDHIVKMEVLYKKAC
jgi:hypothetical protein